MSAELEHRINDALQHAPFDVSRWSDVLSGVAALCGGSSAQFITEGHGHALAIIAPGFTRADGAAYVALGGPDPSANRGAARALATNPLSVVGDYEYADSVVKCATEGCEDDLVRRSVSKALARPMIELFERTFKFGGCQVAEV